MLAVETVTAVAYQYRKQRSAYGSSVNEGVTCLGVSASDIALLAA